MIYFSQGMKSDLYFLVTFQAWREEIFSIIPYLIIGVYVCYIQYMIWYYDGFIGMSLELPHYSQMVKPYVIYADSPKQN